VPNKILYIDMDNVLVDFKSGIMKLPKDQVAAAGGDLDHVPGIFSLMEPMPGAIKAFHELSEIFDTPPSQRPHGRTQVPGQTSWSG
jgi:5'(3')-deoxyribonucleotidase